LQANFVADLVNARRTIVTGIAHYFDIIKIFFLIFLYKATESVLQIDQSESKDRSIESPPINIIVFPVHILIQAVRNKVFDELKCEKSVIVCVGSDDSAGRRMRRIKVFNTATHRVGDTMINVLYPGCGHVKGGVESFKLVEVG
jgi:hypothetical protein